MCVCYSILCAFWKKAHAQEKEKGCKNIGGGLNFIKIQSEMMVYFLGEEEM